MAGKVAGKQPLVPGLDLKVRWSPSRHDKLQPGCSTQPVEGRLIVCKVQHPGLRPVILYLFTTLVDEQLYSVEELVKLYGLRWQVELNLRYIKAQMNMAFLNCQSAEMAQKEWYAGLIAYNLIRGTMLLAALKKGSDPLKLSFSSSRRRVVSFLLNWAQTKKVDWEKLLEKVGKCVLPKRKKRRPSEPRLKRHVRETFGPLRGSRDQARLEIQKQGSKS